MSGADTDRYLVALGLAGRRVLVVGGGRVGEAKVETLRGTGAEIVVVAPTLTARLDDLRRQGVLGWRRRRFRPWDGRGCSLAIAATGDGKTNASVARWARRLGALVNVVDDPARCDVTIPATIRRGAAVIGVTTSGATPAGARFVRETIEEALPADVGQLLAAAADARGRLRAEGRYRYDYQAWRQRLLEPGLEAVRAGGEPGARIEGPIEELRRRFLVEFDAATPIRTGGVTLVGAGPGGIELITVAGAAALAAADVVVYDRLSDPGLLDLAPLAAERVPVGKAKGGGTGQEDINRLLIERARAGNQVVRLKGGDPMVFGRGGEEVDALLAADVPVTVLPGVSSAFGALTLAGIPVTHRGSAASVAVVSGHRATDRSYDWQALARFADTIVVLMAASTAAGVAQRLLGAGRPGDEPVAAVHAAGTATAETARMTLADLARSGCPYPAPTVLVVGAVAARARGPQLSADSALETWPSVQPRGR